MRLTKKNLQSEYQKYKNPASEKEADILKAGEILFGEKGFDGTTTKELAVNAKVTERTLFKYFATKQELYSRILSGIVYEVAFAVQMVKLREMLESRKTKFADWYLFMMKDRVAMARENRHKIRILVTAILQDADFAEFFGKVWKENLYEPALDAIRYYQSTGEIRSDVDVETYVRTSYSINISYLLYRFVIVPDLPVDDDVELKKILYIISQGILA